MLWDTVRVVTRLVGNLDDLLPQDVPAFTNRSRSAQRRMQEIQRMTAKERQRRLVPKYRDLIRTAEHVVESQVLHKPERVSNIDLMTEIAINAVRREIDHYCGLGERVIDQVRRRVLNKEEVPNEYGDPGNLCATTQFRRRRVDEVMPGLGAPS